ncbi:GNAT family N-acetyltransferase [Ruminococcus albus]|uniref:GCN5-related N-acetyltransferase n=1 Tax=Ruminococcus albus (strain ATCC 27210 / DSM 20455 / JCM 14654 / NCDO 2250 / 7) TaxID=697329 RepID=E6UAE1_RUMA7|nr:GNAT family N-acetyltransferase [Ruminococcus albus]ADU22363.1 GCN5-related N-acetyltransferase [Ruminococcus albus 7 = DSM 20455]
MSEKINIIQADINDAAQLHEIEVMSFPPQKAASLEAFEYRLRKFPQWFFKAEKSGKIVGLINGSSSNKLYITDDLYGSDGGYDENGENLLIYGLAVHPDFRHTRVAHLLMDNMINAARSSCKKHISLTCKEALIGFYESLGFTKRGVSRSTIGNMINYDMEMFLDEK